MMVIAVESNQASLSVGWSLCRQPLESIVNGHSVTLSIWTIPHSHLPKDGPSHLCRFAAQKNWPVWKWFSIHHSTVVLASVVEAVIRSPTNMATAEIAAVDFQQNDVKMTSLYRRPACSHVCWGRSASQSMALNASAVVIGHKKSREYLI